MTTPLDETTAASSDFSPQQLDALKRLVPQRFDMDSEKRALVEELAKKYHVPLTGRYDSLKQEAKVAAEIGRAHV